MIRAIASVIRGEGWPSAARRTGERIEEALHDAVLRARGTFVRTTAKATILNISVADVVPRLGGVPLQLLARLQAERTLRPIALLDPRGLELSTPTSRTVGLPGIRPTVELRDLAFESVVREALALTGASAIHLEGTSGVPFESVLRLREAGVEIVLSVSDFSLFCARPHLLEEPAARFCFYSEDLNRCHRCLEMTWDLPLNAQAERRRAARELLFAAKAMIFPSRFLLDRHRHLFALPDLAADVIEPASPAQPPAAPGEPQRRVIAYAGSVKRHKGAHLLPEIIRHVGRPDVEWHVFGGGDEELFRAIRRDRALRVHGYYRAGALPDLLVRHGVGLVMLPSIVPESFGLTLSEAWMAGVPAVAFDLGALAERIRDHGGGWLTPLAGGAEGMAGIVERWLSGDLMAPVPHSFPSAMDAALAHVGLYAQIR
jgi:glycosyltransferase involved in cell wall biosynthesis